MRGHSAGARAEHAPALPTHLPTGWCHLRALAAQLCWCAQRQAPSLRWQHIEQDSISEGDACVAVAPCRIGPQQRKPPLQ